MVKSLMKNPFMLFLFMGGLAIAASGGGTGSIFQPLWDTLDTILSDAYLGYIVAAIMLIRAMSIYFAGQADWGKILIWVLGAGFTASITTLAEALSGAAF